MELNAEAAAAATTRGLAAAEAGQAKAFFEQGLLVISLMTGEVMGENIRQECVRSGVCPTSEKAWGALIRKAIGDGLLVRTGEYRKTIAPKSHSRKTQVYRAGSNG